MNSALPPIDFSAFYHALHGMPPFPWQIMLAERVVEHGWPSCIDLPTASGKTACIDIAVYALACQADQPVEERTVPRRVFFVVDRRIVVDEAFDRASRIAKLLRDAPAGPVKVVADRLLRVGGRGPGAPPLAVTRMRGGIARDDGWVRSPAQPAVITSTVDQFGSRLLFRGYGRNPNVAAVDAGLTGNDALIILDEAHCAVPFSQTARAVERYRSRAWAEYPVRNPFRTVIMSATPPEGIDPGEVFPAPREREAALASNELHRRIAAPKRVELAIARTPPKPRKGEAGLAGDRLSDDLLVLDAADRALKLAAAGRRRIAVMVNRVATARAIFDEIRGATSNGEASDAPDVALMTGRMRPLDRDRLVEQWHPLLKATKNPPELARPAIVVTTQCLEVGADFSFDALITECASLDALRQRFGRLDRLGVFGDAMGAILIRPEQVRTPEQIAKLVQGGKQDDPVYGNALAATWNWLCEHAVPVAGRGGTSAIDMGIGATDARIPADAAERRELLTRLSAPVLDAPVMLPVHIDLWAQTFPRPVPDPDIALFLHGPERGEPEVTVVFRRDLDSRSAPRDSADRGDSWVETVSLLPPTTPEAFSLPLRLVRRWLAAGAVDASALHDVEGAALPDEEPERTRQCPIVLWRGRNASVAFPELAQLRPGDVVVVPGDAPVSRAFTAVVPSEGSANTLDVAEDAFQRSRDRVVLRVHPKILEAWTAHPAVEMLLDWAKVPDRDLDPEDLAERLAALGNDADRSDEPDLPALPRWLRTAAAVLAEGCEVVVHPCDGYILRSRKRLRYWEARQDSIPEGDPFADGDDLASTADRPVKLAGHLTDVAKFARIFAERCLPAVAVEPVVHSAQLHDIGKADPRFQQLLHGGNELAALAEPSLLAKSGAVPSSVRARRRARELAGLPSGFRHELLSVQLAERHFTLPVDPVKRDLILHLIAAHHGFSRPLAPFHQDPHPPGVDLELNGHDVSVSAGERREWLAPHQLDSGVAERYWLCVRRFGWWGLAYLEAILRLADWAGSEAAEAAGREWTEMPIHAGA